MSKPNVPHTYTLAVNRLSEFLPYVQDYNFEGDPAECEELCSLPWNVQCDVWLTNKGKQERLVVIEQVEERCAVNFPAEIAMGDQVVFIRAGKKQRIKSVLVESAEGFHVMSVDYRGPAYRRLLLVSKYILYELQDNGRWEMIEYDGEKLPF